MRIPKNIIKEAQYTSGNEFIDPGKKPYKGYYYEINGKYFEGKTYSKNSIRLTKLDFSKGNPFIKNPLISQLVKLASDKFTSFLFKPSTQDFKKGYSTRYFSKQLGSNPILIKEIDEDNFKNLQKNNLYQVIGLKYDLQKGFNDKEVEEANKTMVGIKEFTKELNTNPANDTDSYPIGRG